MAKNKVQFQKGISIHRFISIYGTEEQCQKRLFAMRWPMGYRCPECGHDKHWKERYGYHKRTLSDTVMYRGEAITWRTIKPTKLQRTSW